MISGRGAKSCSRIKRGASRVRNVRSGATLELSADEMFQDTNVSREGIVLGGMRGW